MPYNIRDMADSEDKLASRRRLMVDRHLRARDIWNDRVLEAFAATPREKFIPPAHHHEAYDDHPLPIGHGQTISQPYVVALMIQELWPQEHHRVLDVGAGSGYQTTLLASMVQHVYAVERIDALAQRARALLAELNITNVTFRTGDGTLGWAEHAPFDGIICGAAAPDVPEAWTEQIADGGRIVLPVGGPCVQRLLVIEKHGDELSRRKLCGVRFVKLIGKQGWETE